MNPTTHMISCSNGHHFPINFGKHLNRYYRICPRCGETIELHGKPFSLNPRWIEEKIQNARQRLVTKIFSRRDLVGYIDIKEYSQNPSLALIRATDRVIFERKMADLKIQRLRWKRQ